MLRTSKASQQHCVKVNFLLLTLSRLLSQLITIACLDWSWMRSFLTMFRAISTNIGCWFLYQLQESFHSFTFQFRARLWCFPASRAVPLTGHCVDIFVNRCQGRLSLISIGGAGGSFVCILRAISWWSKFIIVSYAAYYILLDQANPFSLLTIQIPMFRSRTETTKNSPRFCFDGPKCSGKICSMHQTDSPFSVPRWAIWGVRLFISFPGFSMPEQQATSEGLYFTYHQIWRCGYTDCP